MIASFDLCYDQKESKLTYKCLGGHSFQRSERFSDGFMFCGGCSTVFDSSKRDRFPSRGGQNGKGTLFK